MAPSLHFMNSQQYYEPLRTALQQKNQPEIDRVLCELETVCRKSQSETQNATTHNYFTTNHDELNFWLIDVARLMLEEKSTSTRLVALNALESAVPYLVKTNYQELSVWAELRTTITREYTSLLDTARSEKDPNWHRMWSALVRIMNRELCQGSSIINMFLSIVEAGFRSPELSVREQSFDCWRLLVEVFSSNKQMNLPKRMKLICIPLKSSKSKTEMIALKKFDIWWYLLNELSPSLDKLADTIFEPFIYFCFGPAFKPPLCYYFDAAYQEYGAPGKTYQAIKQLSAIALIHLLGPAPDVTKTLLISSDVAGRTLSFEFPKHVIAISSMLFSAKAKLLIDASIECTVLFAQMKHLDFMELNRCLWRNLMERVTAETTITKNELLQRIRDVMNALLRLCIMQEHDVSLRELLYDTLLIIAKSDLLTVRVGYDSPEQPMLNYKSFMSVILNPELPCPIDKSEAIVEYVFDLQRYSKQKGYWEMLQKAIQYLCETDDDNCKEEFRSIRTQIYTQLARCVIVQIRDDPEGFAGHQSTVMNFLLYPLEYDQSVSIDNVRNLWIEVYEQITLHESNSCEFTDTFCEMIKSMTIAKFAFNLGVVADFFCTILQSLSPDFDSNKPPMKVFELFKDLTRKAQAYQANLNRVEKMICCFRELLEKMSITNMLTLILPIRNAIIEMTSNENSLAMEEVRGTLNVMASKMASASMAGKLVHEPKEVQWNCRMLLSMMLDLPATLKKGWKQADMRKCMNIGDDKQPRTPTRKKIDDEFVVIESNWKFKPEALTDHQREKMMEKRADIPALYNDMSQSQDSFVIKPWTPNKQQDPVRHDRLATAIVSSSADTILKASDGSLLEQCTETVGADGVTIGSTSEGEQSKLDGRSTDKENNYGNILYEQPQIVEGLKGDLESSEGDEQERTSETHNKYSKKSKRSILEQLRIDTVEGKTLDVMNLARTRRSEAPESRSALRKNIPTRKVASERKPRATTSSKVKEKKVFSVEKITTRNDIRKDSKGSSRMLLNFENIEQEVNQNQSNMNTADDVIESSQIPNASQSFVGKIMSMRRSKVEESSVNPDLYTSGTILAEEKAPIQVNTKEAEEEAITAETIEVSKSEVNNISTVDHECEPMEVDDRNENIAPASKIVVTRTVVEYQKINGSVAEDEKIETPKKKETRIETASVAPMSPGRRSTRSTSMDDNTALLITTPLPADAKQEKGTPSKSKLSFTDITVRATLQLLNSPKKPPTEGSVPSQAPAENRTGLASPKVARYSPLVVLEPIKDFITLAKVDAAATSCNEQDAKLKDLVVTTGPGANCIEPILDIPSVTSNQLSPVKNLDDEMEPLNKSLNRSIVSSPDLVDAEERNTDLMNSTLNISPIAEEKSECPKVSDISVLAGSADRRPFGKGVGLDRDPCVLITPVKMSSMSRRTKPSLSPPMHGAGPLNAGCLKALRAHPNQPSLPVSSTSVVGTPKSPSTHMISLSGRGAQLINLIRQSPKPNTPPQNASTPKGGQTVASANRLMMRKKAIVASAASATPEGSAQAASASKLIEESGDPTQYLVFSKVLPSPQASPASSILKRRHNVDDSCDDIDSPVNKRKRVSFHDPPVSVTKEYIRQVEECRSPSINRCLQLATSMSSVDKAKYMMRRRSKSDSISELKNFTKNHDGFQSEPTVTVTNNDTQCNGGVAVNANADDEELTSSPESLDECQFMISDATDNMAPLQVTVDGEKSSTEQESTSVDDDTSGSKSASSRKTSEQVASSAFSFSSEEAVLQHVLHRYTLEDIVERYMTAGQTLEHGKSVRMLTKELSTVMSKDSKTCHLVLDELSERHSVEFLEHAIQENSSAMVCERLSVTAMTDHILKHLRSECDTGSTSNTGASSLLDEKDNDRLRLVQRIYENLIDLPNIESNGQTMVMLQDRFLRQTLARKNRLEIMALLEDYFKTDDQA